MGPEQSYCSYTIGYPTNDVQIQLLPEYLGIFDEENAVEAAGAREVGLSININCLGIFDAE
jgi:hypothetical protein